MAKSAETRAEDKKRAKKLSGIMTKIAMFAVQDTFSDEQKLQGMLAAAILQLEQAEKLILADE